MSASLVGSEMCIRDSPPERAGPSADSACAPAPPPPRVVPPPVWPAHPTVSYTHLTLPTICSV
eukprot:12039192-Alexandrium_andersonii.AAC.1